MWTETIDRHGGDATLVHLPAIGIRGKGLVAGFAVSWWLERRDVAESMAE